MNCPGCGGTLTEGQGARSTAECAGCGGLWVPDPVLRATIAEFLKQSGCDGAIVPLHEAPRGASDRKCPECGAVLDAVDLRGVAVERCNGCDAYFLEPGEVGLISQRVLISARSPKGRQPLSSNPILVEMLRNPRSSG